MPEGHTIHRMARDHRRWLRGAEVAADSPQGRASALAAEIDGRRLAGTDAYGKHLLHRWEGDLTVHIHLGLFGRFYRRKLPAPDPTPGTRLQLATETHILRLSGPTACRELDPAEEDDLVARLGPDPLRADADPERALASLSRRRIPIAAAVMDQRVIAGIGNVYRAEALNVLGIHPHLPSRELAEDDFWALWTTLGSMLALGVKERRIVTRRDVDVKRLPRRARATWVYKQAHCARCGTPVIKETMAARNLFWCPTCQPKKSRRSRTKAGRNRS